jgi:hypothetical protein
VEAAPNNEGVDAAPKSEGVEAAPAAGADVAPNRDGVEAAAAGCAPKSEGALAGAPNAGVLTAPKPGVGCAAPKPKAGVDAGAGVAAAPKAGVEAAPKLKEGVEAGVAVPKLNAMLQAAPPGSEMCLMISRPAPARMQGVDGAQSSVVVISTADCCSNMTYKACRAKRSTGYSSGGPSSSPLGSVT